MKRCFDELYQQFSKELAAVKDACPDELQQIEARFLIANKYKMLLREEVVNHPFETPSDEINFFRHVKPLFGAEEDYNRLCYHAALFKKEVADPVKVREFWARESLRLEKFTLENRDFYQYFRSGRTDKDKWFFVSRDLKSSDVEQATVSKYDPLVSMLIALERYQEFVVREALGES